MADLPETAGAESPEKRRPETRRAAVAFARLLRRAGIDVPVGATLTFARALEALGVQRPAGVYWAGRSALAIRPEDIALYDAAYAAFWWGAGASGDAVPARRVELALGFDVGGAGSAHVDDARAEPVGDVPVVAVRWSPAELLRHRNFASYTPDEFAESQRLMTDLRVHAALRRSRRHRPSRAHRGRLDVRRTVRRALRAGGEPIAWCFTAAAQRPRRLVLLLDVSGSMEPYARALLRFAHAAVAGRRAGAVEAFTIGTRLTRVTRELSSRDPDASLAAAARSVADWSGGTRLGEALKTFNERWGVAGLARGAVVVFLSDGWDRGDPESLAEQMARLRRVAAKIIWVNPLKATPGYAPLARGMAAALPYVDEFVEGHSLASLEDLVKVVAT